MGIVTLRRHLKTVKVDGKRVVPFGAKKEGVVAGRKLKAGLKGIKSYSSEMPRAVLGAQTAQRAFRLNGAKNAKIRIRREIGFANFFNDEKKAMQVLAEKFNNNELEARNAWLKGDNFGGSMKSAKQIAETIIKKRLGLALATEAGKGGFGRKAVPVKDVLLDNVTHSWIVESVVQRLTHNLPKRPIMSGMVKETEGIKLQFVKQPSGKYRVTMAYEEFAGDVTKNFAECMPSTMRKYLE